MKTLKLFFAIVTVILLFSGCEYNFIVPENIPVIDPDDPNAPQISFISEIVPIFNNNNNCTSCHKTGGQNPDLTIENSFKSLNSTRYINSASPAESKIYAWPHPDSDNHMQKKYTTTEAALILAWIQQGAKNN